MRTELAKRKNIGSRNKALARKTYRGTYQRTGKKHGKQHGATLLLTDIHQKGSGKILTSHHWLNYTREFAKLDERATTTDKAQQDSKRQSFQLLLLLHLLRLVPARHNVLCSARPTCQPLSTLQHNTRTSSFFPFFLDTL